MTGRIDNMGVVDDDCNENPTKISAAMTIFLAWTRAGASEVGSEVERLLIRHKVEAH